MKAKTSLVGSSSVSAQQLLNIYHRRSMTQNVKLYKVCTKSGRRAAMRLLTKREVIGTIDWQRSSEHHTDDVQTFLGRL